MTDNWEKDWQKYKGMRIEDLVAQIVPPHLRQEGEALEVEARYMLVKLPRGYWAAIEDINAIFEVPLEDTVSFMIAGNPLLLQAFFSKIIEMDMRKKGGDGL